MQKILWVVNYNNLDDFVKQATAAKVTAVAIRTDNDVAKAIPKFQDLGIKVYGWRWPSIKRDPALKEADKAANLLANGLDGYYADPEGHEGNPYDDWDQHGLESLAEEFCKTITSGASGKPFGTTSHFRGAKVFGKLPWKSFFKYTTVFLPQAYWRSEEGRIGYGEPRGNYRESLTAWSETGAPMDKIVPMAGQLEQSTAAEIDVYAAAAAEFKRTELHFYAAEPKIRPEIWAAIARAGQSAPAASAPKPPAAAAIAFRGPLKPAAEFTMPLKESRDLQIGTFTIRSKGGDILYSADATSGIRGSQSRKLLWQPNAGAIPDDAENGPLTLETAEWHSSTIGGIGFRILPDVLKKGNRTRSYFRVHRDINLPGSAGCVCISTQGAFDLLCGTMRDLRQGGISTLPITINYV